MRLLRRLLNVLVYILLVVSILGILLVDNYLKELGYLFVSFLMMDILYRKYYNENKKSK